jgi:hypothetical protein
MRILACPVEKLKFRISPNYVLILILSSTHIMLYSALTTYDYELFELQSYVNKGHVAEAQYGTEV